MKAPQRLLPFLLSLSTLAACSAAEPDHSATMRASTPRDVTRPPIREREETTSECRPEEAALQSALVDRKGVPDAATFVDRCRERGVLLNAFGPRVVRSVTHLNVTAEDCRAAARVMRAVADGR